MMGSKFLFIILIRISLFIFSAQATSKYEFTNIVCKSLDKEFSDFEYCFLKSVNRSYKYTSLKVKLYKLPITEVKIRYALLKRANGYKPFLYNITFDACEFLRSPNNPVTKIAFTLIKKHTNMNHTCPFDHDLIVEKLDSSYVADKLSVLPIPSGDYAVYSTWFAYDIPRADVNIYVKITD
ncbi:uncharacterized protein LOC119686402 [Teleopsis dalmanni]|uniref:uncharacterized protein LOC119685936 n=1 Tax=Teleopsis dalmanni TaxID=139649 RepID=UPI0018CF08E5|nr:uncharacterized protein LOC119685936 [Teleopsis dalmanni]XP_037956785.1 uncharacterized protein LOC119686303 [Teleopsis dalmanni]XP_037956907.1 uncharacterized protein LOC119686402 [Teleopsis dalmanni]